LTFRLVQGPPFVSVVTVDRGHGLGRGEIQSAPDSCAPGKTWECSVEVSDGTDADRDTALLIVKPVQRRRPTSPMTLSTAGEVPVTGTSHSAPNWIVGEWEWTGTNTWKGAGGRPEGMRRRLLLRPNGKMSNFEIKSGRVTRATDGIYRFEPSGDRGTISFSNFDVPWPSRPASVTYSLTRDASGFSIYPAGVIDGWTERYIRVPSVVREGAAVDTSRLLDPIERPPVRRHGDQTEIALPKPMKDALARLDPAFVPWSESDRRRLGEHIRGPSTITGDFDGDFIQDVAILGRSGADQLVIALLSNLGAVTAKEVVWRKVRIGTGESRSRADPKEIPPIYLESVPRGTVNSFCWVVGPADAIGIVQPGLGRFDYVDTENHFVLGSP
jgi:hypothetical protein